MAAAPLERLARDRPRKLIRQSLVLSEEVTNLPPPHADVARRHVRVRADVAIQLAHEALAEPHDLVVALALGVEIRSPLATADGKRGQTVLEYLLESQKLQDAQVHAGMKPQSALVRPNGA